MDIKDICEKVRQSRGYTIEELHKGLWYFSFHALGDLSWDALGTRAYTCLRRKGIRYKEELIDLIEQDGVDGLENIRGVGDITKSDIIRYVNSFSDKKYEVKPKVREKVIVEYKDKILTRDEEIKIAANVFCSIKSEEEKKLFSKYISEYYGGKEC